jgi:phosphatidylglycerol:prolipoprotein diacylglycerol transferase
LKAIYHFPGLGIEEFKINSVAFRIGNYEIVWYGIIITLGIVAAVSYVICIARVRRRLKPTTCLTLRFMLCWQGLVGARLYYVLMNLSLYIDTLYKHTWLQFGKADLPYTAV